MSVRARTAGLRSTGYLSLVVLACVALTSRPALADTLAVDTAVPAAPETPINLWAKSAPLSVLVQQLGQLSGRDVELGSELDVQVSGRFSGNLEQALAILSTEYPVLFDLDQGVLRAEGKANSRSVAVAVISDELSEPFKQSLFEQIAPGNDIEIRSDSVRVTGHPVFVKRAAEMVARARTLAHDSGAGSLAEQNAEGELDITVNDAAETPTESIPPTDVTVIDSGSAELLADIADEGKPTDEQATLARPIRWVTDIPGFDTF